MSLSKGPRIALQGRAEHVRPSGVRRQAQEPPRGPHIHLELRSAPREFDPASSAPTRRSLRSKLATQARNMRGTFVRNTIGIRRICVRGVPPTRNHFHSVTSASIFASGGFPTTFFCVASEMALLCSSHSTIHSRLSSGSAMAEKIEKSRARSQLEGPPLAQPSAHEGRG